jgi:hypothetical protein
MPNLPWRFPSRLLSDANKKQLVRIILLELLLMIFGREVAGLDTGSDKERAL